MNKKCSKRLSGFLALVMMLSVILVGMPEVAGAESTCKNLLNNGDFEEWSNGLPVAWYGSKSNIAKSKVNQIDTGAKSGNYAVQLTEAGSSHKRFTCQPISLKADANYTLTYWAKGKGEIRNAFYSSSLGGDGYSNYSEYTKLDTDEWQEITYTFSHNIGSEDMEVIFSVRNASEEKGYIQIDDVVLTSDEEEVPLDKVANVTATLKSGTVRKGTEVILQTSTEDATVYYTVDGTDPTIASVEYSEPITINEDTTIKAIAVKEGLDDSDISTFEYTIVELMNIAEARTKAVGDYVWVQGIVTFVDGGNNYIQDETAGIDVFIYDVGLKEGDNIDVFGKIDVYYGLVEIKPDSVKDVEKLSSENELPEPILTTIAEVNDNKHQGQLVEIKNLTIGAINTGGNTPITDGDGSTINIYRVPTLTDIVEGDKVNVIAIASIYNTPQLRVRYAEDITKVEEEDPTPKPIEVPYTAEGEITEINPDTVIYEEGKFLVPEGVTEFSFKDGEKEMKASLVEDEWVIEEVKEEEPIPEPEGNYPVVLQNAIKTEDKLVVNLYNFEENMNGIVIIKVLDENNKPYIIDYTESMNITKGKNTVEFTLDSSKYKRGISGVKVYVWQSFDIMKPFARQKTFDL